MRPFHELTRRGRVRRLRRIALSALALHGLVPTRLRKVSFQDDAVFRAETARGTFAVRVLGYEGISLEEARSELLWLEALARDTDVVAPRPLRTPDDRLLVAVAAPGVPEPRLCTVLGWVHGTRRRKPPRPLDLRRVGRLMATLHAHAVQWPRPAGFRRREWTATTVFGHDGFGGPGRRDPWPHLPPEHRSVFEDGAAAGREAFELCTRTAADVGLLHADLHFWNVLFADGDARPIDFGDCGPGPWAYDLATTLSYVRGAEGYPALRDALLRGYEDVRPVPAGHADDLDRMIAGRLVGVGLWGAAVFGDEDDDGVPMRKWLLTLEGRIRLCLRDA